MSTEALELLLKFRAEGEAQLQKIVDSVQGIQPAAQTGGKSLSDLEKGLGGAGKASEGAGQQFQGLASRIESGITSPAASAKQEVMGLLETLGKGPAIAAGVALGLGAAGKSALDLVAQMGAAAEQTLNFADRLGLTVSQAERLRAAAKIAGVNIESLEGAARTMAAALEDSSGQGEKAAAALRKIGVSTFTASGEQRELGIVLLDTLAALSKIESTSERTAAALRTLPKGAAKELMPLITNYAELNRVVEELGVGMDENLTRRLADADDELGKLGVAWDRFLKKLSAKIEPITIPVVVSLTGWLNDKTEYGPDGLPVKSEPPMAGTGRNGRGEIVLKDGPYDRLTGMLDAVPGRMGASAWDFIKKEIEGGKAAADAFRTTRTASREWRERRVTQLRDEIAKLDAALASGDLSQSAFGSKKAEFDRLSDELAKLEASLKRTTQTNANDGSLRLTDLWAKDAEAWGKRRRKPSLFAPGDVFEASPVGDTNEERARKANEAHGRALLEAEEKRTNLRREMESRSIAAQERLIELTAGPGGELEAAQKIRDLRLESAETLLDVQKAVLDYAVKEAEIRSRSMEKYRDEAGKVFDALTAKGGGGLRDLFAGQLKLIERQMLVNLLGESFQKFGGFLGSVGEKSGLPGWLLKGTIFDPANKSTPEIASRDKNTKAIDRLTAAISGAPVAGASGDVVGAFSSIGGLFGSGANKLNPFIFHAAGVTNPIPYEYSPLPTLNGGAVQNPLGGGFVSTQPKMSGAMRGFGIAGAAAGGFFGTMAGIQEGGARGAVTATGSLAGATGAILSLAGVSGPAAPILMGVGLAMGMVHSLFGDPKQKRDAEINRMIQGARYAEPESMERSVDLLSGGDTDYDYRGRVRVINKTTITVPVQAMDARSFLDRAHEIGLAARKAIQDGNPLGDQILQTVGVNR